MDDAFISALLGQTVAVANGPILLAVASFYRVAGTFMQTHLMHKWTSRVLYFIIGDYCYHCIMSAMTQNSLIQSFLASIFFTGLVSKSTS